MRLSEAIRIGRQLRPETHQGEMFVRLANLDELGSDVWGAACEAVHSPVSKRSWTEATLNSDRNYAAEILQKYFGHYWKMPANCPGAKRLGLIHSRGRFVDSGQAEFVVEPGSEVEVFGGLTTACEHVLSLGQFIGHAFYVHNWSSEQCAENVEWYENVSVPIIAPFEHYQNESLRQQIAQRVVMDARIREYKRRQQQTGNRVYGNLGGN